MRVPVKPALLHWACERAAVDEDAVVARFPHFPEWVSGDKQPTLRQLEDFANAMHVAVGLLFLPEPPPPEPLPIPDFRTMRSAPLKKASADLLDTLYLCQRRQEWYRDYARGSGEGAHEIVGSAKATEDVVKVATRMRHALGFDLQQRRRARTWEEALRSFIEQAEGVGVLVMVSGVVGSNNTRRLDPDEFRGFALADPLAPLVFINGSDTKAAQMFTLAHELAHVWLGTTALSDAEAGSVPNSNSVEKWCNQVAAELLVPLDEVGQQFEPRAALEDEMTRLARAFKVSTLVVLRRIFDAGGINKQRLRDAYSKEVARLISLAKKEKEGGGDFYATLGVRAGKRFARALVISALEGRASFTEAFRLLGFRKMSSFDDLARSLGVGM